MFSSSHTSRVVTGLRPSRAAIPAAASERRRLQPTPMASRSGRYEAPRAQGMYGKDFPMILVAGGAVAEAISWRIDLPMMWQETAAPSVCICMDFASIKRDLVATHPAATRSWRHSPRRTRQDGFVSPATLDRGCPPCSCGGVLPRPWHPQRARRSPRPPPPASRRAARRRWDGGRPARRVHPV